jgi:hypothetical protein
VGGYELKRGQPIVLTSGEIETAFRFAIQGTTTDASIEQVCLTGAIFACQEEGRMKPRILPPLLLLLLIPIGRSTAQQSLDPKQAALAAHFKSLTRAELLLPKAWSGDAEAQYWVGRMDEEGRLVPKDFRQNAPRFLENPSK